MKSLKSVFVVFSSIGLLFLAACSSGNQTANPASSPTADSSVGNPPASLETMATNPAAPGHNEAKKGGQVIESGPYHLEFVPEKEAEAIHLDFYLLKGENHEPIPNAKVTVQVELPDRSQKSLEMKYDAADQHYTAKLTSTAAGAYKVAILTDINGEKVNARYSFTQ